MTILFNHQKEILDRSKDLSRFALFTEPGTGKTFMSIRTIEWQYTTEQISAALVICPKSVMYTWVDQLRKHSTLPYEVIMWNGFHKPEDKAAYSKAMKAGFLIYFIANTDCFVSKNFNTVAKHYLESRREVFLVVDECTAFKDLKAKRTKSCIALADKCTSVRILSGTPITNSPLDMFSEARILGKTVKMLGYSSYFAFKTRYCILQKKIFGARAFDQVVGYRDLGDLASKVSKFAAIVKLNDCIDMPERVFSKVLVEMPPKQREIYDELRLKAVAEIEDTEVTVVNALSMMSKLLQIISGQLKLADGTYSTIPNNRLDTLQEIVEEREGKILIWSSFVQTSRNIVKHFDKASYEILHLSADLNPQEREAIIERFKSEPNIRCLVLNPQSAAHGLNLTEAKTSIYFNNTYSLEQRLQSLARNYRINQSSKTVVIDIIAKNTIEEKILESLDKMEDISKEVMDKAQMLKWLS